MLAMSVSGAKRQLRITKNIMADIHIECDYCKKSVPETDGYYTRNKFTFYDPNAHEQFLCKKCYNADKNGTLIVMWCFNGFCVLLVIGFIIVLILLAIGVL